MLARYSGHTAWSSCHLGNSRGVVWKAQGAAPPHATRLAEWMAASHPPDMPTPNWRGVKYEDKRATRTSFALCALETICLRTPSIIIIVAIIITLFGLLSCMRVNECPYFSCYCVLCVIIQQNVSITISAMYSDFAAPPHSTRFLLRPIAIRQHCCYCGNFPKYIRNVSPRVRPLASSAPPPPHTHTTADAAVP